MDQRRTGRFIADVAFVVFTVASAAAFTWMTVRHPGGLEGGLLTVIWLGFAVMAIDRFWLRRRQGSHGRPDGDDEGSAGDQDPRDG